MLKGKYRVSGYSKTVLHLTANCGGQMDKLSDKQRNFVNEYCKDFNGTQAATRAGYSQNTAQEQASRLLSNVMIQAAIEERKEELAEKAALTPLRVLREWSRIAFADAADIVKITKTCCRYCHGFDHRYQWTEAEYQKAVEKAIGGGKDAPDAFGGFGYDMTAEPAKGCPECGGNGIENVQITDTRKLNGNAKRLYAGVKKTKDGVQVLMRDQDKALENIAKYLGMFIERKEISGPDGSPIATLGLEAKDLTDEQLLKIIGDDTDESGGGA